MSIHVALNHVTHYRYDRRVGLSPQIVRLRPAAHSTPREGAERLIGADASHAWVAVWCPPSGWVEFDPTNGVRTGLDHTALAWGRDFGDVSPPRGVIVGGGRHALSVLPEDG